MYLILDHKENQESFTESINFNVAEVQINPEFDSISKDNVVVLGIDKNILDDAVVLYPNPVSTILNIKKPDTITVDHIRIYNVLGQPVYISGWTHTIDLSALPSGLFFVELQTIIGNINKSLLKN